MKKAILYVFSGTGNTMFAARNIASELKEKYGYATQIERITGGGSPTQITLSEGDLVGVGYPIHAFKAPKIVVNYIKKLPKTSNTPTFIFKTSGEPFWLNNCSSCCIKRILTRKGYDVMSDTHLLMPYNIMFRYENTLVKQMCLHTQAMAKLVALRAERGERDRLRYGITSRCISFIFRIQHLGARINGPLIHAKKDKCTACGLCVKNCPTGNIVIKDGRARFGKKCAMCMACATFCPIDAVRPGFLSRWRVNGGYDYEKLMGDTSLSSDFVREDTKGYFRLFRKYYLSTYAELKSRGIEVK